MAGKMEIAINTLPFWSRFVLPYDLHFDGVALVRTLFTRGFKVPVFDYRQGESSALALAGATATERDTILVKAAQTRGGGRYTIKGISITKDGLPYTSPGDGTRDAGLIHELHPAFSLQPDNDPAVNPQMVMSPEDFRALDSLMQHLFNDFFRLELSIDGTRRVLEMGPAQIYPGVGGVKSTVDSTNGDTFQSNYMAIPEGIQWNPSGAVDSNMVLKLIAAYDAVVPTWTPPVPIAGEVIANPKPTPIGRLWRQGYIVQFHGFEESPTSAVS